MNKIVLGKYVNTHGIKGEIRIKSDFKYKDRVFKENNEIFIEDKSYIINSYRIHKDYDMITLKGINDINQIEDLKGSLVYIDKDKYMNDEEYTDSDLIGFDVIYNDKKYKLEGIEYLNHNKKLLVINSKYVPMELVKKIDVKNRQITLEYLEGVL